MPFNIDKEDFRITKTKKALNEAMFMLLEHQNFKKITVRDICEEALISRASFYTYYTDKFDLLKSWLSSIKPDNIGIDDTYEKLEKRINQFVNTNEKVIKNIISNADSETLDIVFDLILSFLNLTNEKEYSGNVNPKFIVLSNILAGGMVNYLLWHVKNKFPFEVMNQHLYDIIRKLRESELR